jgi:hypothetical protein
VYIVFALYSPPTSFPCYLPLPLIPPLPSFSTLLFSKVSEEKRKKWLFFEIKKLSFSLWYFHVYMYYKPRWFISYNFLHTILVLFLWWFQPVYDFCIHSCTDSVSTTFNLLVSLFYSTHPLCDLPLVWPVFHNVAAFVSGLYSTWKREHVIFDLLSLANFT